MALRKRDGSFSPTGGTVYLNEQITVTWPYEPSWGAYLSLQIWYDNGAFIKNIPDGQNLPNTNPGAYNWTPVNFTPGQYYTLNICNTNSTERDDFPNPIWLTTTSTSSTVSTGPTSSTTSQTSAATTTPEISSATNNSSVTPSSSYNSGSSTNKAEVIGGAVGGVLGGLLLLAVVGFMILWHRRHRRKGLAYYRDSKDHGPTPSDANRQSTLQELPGRQQSLKELPNRHERAEELPDERPQPPSELSG